MHVPSWCLCSVSPSLLATLVSREEQVPSSFHEVHALTRHTDSHCMSTSKAYAFQQWALSGTRGCMQPHMAWHSTARHSTARHSTAQHGTAQHSRAEQSTAQDIVVHTCMLYACKTTASVWDGAAYPFVEVTIMHTLAFFHCSPNMQLHLQSLLIQKP